AARPRVAGVSLLACAARFFARGRVRPPEAVSVSGMPLAASPQRDPRELHDALPIVARGRTVGAVAIDRDMIGVDHAPAWRRQREIDRAGGGIPASHVARVVPCARKHTQGNAYDAGRSSEARLGPPVHHPPARAAWVA